MTSYPSYITTETHELAYERAKAGGADNLYVGTLSVLRLWDTADRPTWWAEDFAVQSSGDRQPHEIANDMYGREGQRPYPIDYSDLSYKLQVRAPLSEVERQRIAETPDWLLTLPDDYDPTTPTE